MRLLALPLIILLATSLAAEEELPQNPSEPEPLEIEPPLLIQQDPTHGALPSTPGVAPEVDLERMQVALEKAKKSAASGERLFRAGIIAKIEAENRAFKVVRLTADLANARLEVAKKNLAALQSRDAAEISQAELEQATNALAAADRDAAEATAQRQKAELDAAFVNLQRQKKLLALGSGRKSEVSRAEEKIATLQQQKN